MSNKTKPKVEAAIVGALLGICSAAQAVSVGAFICSVDHCRKHYLSRGEMLVDACKAGVENALKSGPASAACAKMCDGAYSGDGSVMNQACKEGCSLFPSACLRDGKIPPKM